MMQVHNICFHAEIRELFIEIALLSTGMTGNICVAFIPKHLMAGLTLIEINLDVQTHLVFAVHIRWV